MLYYIKILLRSLQKIIVKSHHTFIVNEFIYNKEWG